MKKTYDELRIMSERLREHQLLKYRLEQALNDYADENDHVQDKYAEANVHMMIVSGSIHIPASDFVSVLLFLKGQTELRILKMEREFEAAGVIP